MTLPVSSYEDLLADVRKIRIETLRLHRQVRFDLFNQESPDENQNFSYGEQYYEKEKILADVFIQNCDRKSDVGQNCLEHKSLGFHPRIQQGIDIDCHPSYMNIRPTDNYQPGPLSKRCSDEDVHPGFRSKRRSDEDYQASPLTKRPLNESFPPGFLINRLSDEEFKPTFLANPGSEQDFQPCWTADGEVRQIIRQDESDAWPKRCQRALYEDSDLRQHSDRQGHHHPCENSPCDSRGGYRGRTAGGRDVGVSVGVGVGVSVGVGVEASASCAGQQQQQHQQQHQRQRRPHRASGATPLASVAAHEPESSTDAAATVRPVNGTESGEKGAATSTSLATRCARASRTPGRDLLEATRCIDNEANNKEDAMEPEVKEEDERRSATPSPELYGRRSKQYNEDGSSEDENRLDSTSQSRRMPSSYRGTWPIRRDLWANQQMGFSNQQGSSAAVHNDMASVMSFSSNASGAFGCSAEMQGHRRLGAKVDVVYNLLGMLGSTEGREDMSATLLSMSNSIDSCLVMRQSGCLPLLVHLIHAPGQDPETRERASRALHNVVHAKSDERPGRREARVLRFLEQLRDYCQAVRTSLETGQVPEDLERHPAPTIAALMKLSFDEAHRHAMCQLGGLHAVAELIEMDHMAYGSECEDQNRITLRRYAGMALTNLTFGDGNNKALLCSFREFMKALVNQLRSPSDDLRQVTASVLRNLSWKADSSSKLTLRQVGAVTGLMKAAMEGRKESTLKSILSALWNLSAHCSENKVDICAVDGALAFLVDMLSYKAPSKTLAIVENAGGILRNVSSHVAVREDYRAIVRERGCLQVLLQQLKSPSLTVVSNACGALWNLSAKCPQDQRLLWDLGAVPMLRSLVHSKHKMISMGSSAALKNLLSARPGCSNLVHLDSTARGLGLPTLPTLVARRQKALEQEIDQNLSETCDNIEPSTSPTNKDDKFAFKVDHSFLGLGSRGLRSYQQLHSQPSTSSGIANGKCNGVPRSESRESMRSVTSTHSDTMFERVNRHVVNGMSPTDVQMKQQSSSLHSAVGFDTMSGESHAKATISEKKYALRYKNAIPDRLKPADVAFTDITELKCTNSTISWSSAPDQESACSQMLLHSSVEDNLSITSQTLLSASKGDIQSSIAEETEATVSPKEYQSAEPKSLPYKEKPSPVSETVSFTNIYSDKSLIRQRDSLNAIQKTISPTISHADGDLFGNYAETDLDQPTDYSLRYAEGTLEEDGEKPHSGYFPANEQSLIHEDTIKTYCTEGTPRGTSLNSSRAASATDLQEDTRKNLIKDLAIKADRAGQSKNVAALNDGKLNEPRIDSTVRAANQLMDDKLPNLHNYEAKVKAMFQQITSTDYDDTSIRSPSSVRTTPTQMTSNSSEYSETTAISNRANVKLDVSNEFMSQNAIYGTVLEKDLTSNDIGTYTGNSTSKTSNDSGYQVSDGDEDDEDLLAACINIGMQNNRHRHSFIGNSFEKLPRQECNLTRYQTSVALDQVESIKAEGDAVSSFNITQSTSAKSASNISCAEPSNVSLNAARKSQYDAESVPRDTDSKYGWQDQTILQNLNKEMPSKPESEDSKLMFLPVNRGSNICTNSALSSSEQLPAKALHKDTAQINFATLNNSNMDSTQVKDILETKDSESSESIDSVERSEHALLELCIKPGIPKTIDSHDSQMIKLNQLLSKASAKVEDTLDEKSDGAKEEIYDDTQSEDASIGAFEVTRSDEVDTVPKNEKEDVYRRQRDPDAMIASLDRLTAALVQQTEAMREREATTTMKQSTISDTWNEESPNEVSFPSISISAPLIASFKSDVPEDQGTIMSELAEIENADNGMTDSKIIQREAIKLAEAVVAEASKHQELNAASITSIDLDAIKPPSSMGSLVSLTASYAGSADNTETFINRDRCHSTSLPVVQLKTQSPVGGRKKSLPIGVVARRALGQGQNHTGSLENLLNECTNSHLENVKPPSMMDDLPDVGDMENSMLSVASITSEIADSKEHDSHSLTGSDPVFDLLKPVANVLSITCMRYAESLQTSGNNSLSECLENINPPSLFNEVSEMEESTMEATTDTLCSDTLCIETELHTDEASRTLVGDKIDEIGDNDTDECATPLSSEYCVSSSAESTPKRRPNKNHLTPKQKRNLAKERYKTYTIAAEIVKKEEEQRRKMENPDTSDVNRIPRGKISPLTKLTPKQRRQEDRARFQTQVLENPFPEIIAMAKRAEPEQIVEQQEKPEKSEVTSPVKTSIPTLTKLPVCKALRKKRMESGEGERYRTRTLNDAESILKDGECSPLSNAIPSQTKQSDIHDICPEEIQTLLEQNATIVINTLNESSKAHDSLGDDLLLECETLSLVSNDSESERSLRMRFVNGLSQKLIGVSPLPTESAGVSPSREEAEERRETYGGKTAASHEDAGSVDRASSPSEDESSNCLDEQPQETKRPRIIKPGMGSRDLSADSNTTDKSEPGSPKAIRGRRKALYSNPITRKSTPQSSPLKQPNPVSGIPIGRSNTSPIVRATRATTLRQNNNSPNSATKDSPKLNGSPKMTATSVDEKNAARSSAASKRVSVPQKGSTLTFTKTPKRHSTPPACSTNYQAEPKPEPAVIKPLERQGTFTKDEPEVENAPTVPSSDSPVKTKIAKPIRSTSSKVHPTAGKSKISVRTYQTHQTKIAKANSAEKIPTSKGLPLSVGSGKRLPTGKASGIGKLSTGSQNTTQTEVGKTFRKVGPLGQRSNSNSSIVSNAAATVQSRKLVKEATSKIASLRKKVEECKTKQRLQNVTDTRQWISPGSGATETDAPSGLNKGQAFRLFRSSTFEGVPQENNDGSAGTALYKAKSKRPSVMSIQANGVKYRNSCDLSGMNSSEAPCKIPVKSSDAKKDAGQLDDHGVIFRRQQSTDGQQNEVDPTKRISRLGSFIRVDPTNPDGVAQIHVGSNGVRTPASAIVPPFNYNPKQDIPTQTAKPRSEDTDSKLDVDYHADIVTASARVTTV